MLHLLESKKEPVCVYITRRNKAHELYVGQEVTVVMKDGTRTPCTIASAKESTHSCYTGTLYVHPMSNPSDTAGIFSKDIAYIKTSSRPTAKFLYTCATVLIALSMLLIICTFAYTFLERGLL